MSLFEFKLFLLLVTILLIDVDCHNCGTVKILLEGRVTGGRLTEKGQWPFLAALYYAELPKFFCAATLISSKHVLTGK